MAKASEVLEMLCPKTLYSTVGHNYEDITWYDEKPAITKEEYEAGFAQVDAWKAEQDAAKAAQKAALLDRLGISEDEAKLLLG
ncbi:MAG: hypothetical protein ACO3E4_07400 [Candidatus Nanopelagicaceae bacterium]